MDARTLYMQLETDFVRPNMTDDWAAYMDSVKEYLCENFKLRSIGLVCDNTQNIKKVYTAVFPSEEVMKTIIDRNETDVLLFVHHPSIWDIRKVPDVFQQMNTFLLKKFKEKRISIYCLHVPLDNFGQYSTSVNLAKALDIGVEKPFGEYFGALCGVVGTTNCKNTLELRDKFRIAVEHQVNLYPYGDKKIKDGKVAIVAGGGFEAEIMKHLLKEKINTFITGITVLNDHTIAAHDFAKENKINILGGTHYSTEKFACKAMYEYFEKIGIVSEFIEDKPVSEDM